MRDPVRLTLFGAVLILGTTVTLADEAPPPPFTLSAGTPGSPPSATTPPADAAPLDAAATKALLDRLPPLPPADEGRDFAKRAGPPAPPRAGADVRAPFPPPPGAPRPEAERGPLEVVRFQPEGDVPLAPALSVTFSRAMVPVASVEAVAREQVPVRLEPQPPGRWRWIGTRTLLFEPDGGRFPMATEYRVEVPAGTASASGGTLEEAVAFGFRTPPPTVVDHGPIRGPTRRDPLVHVTFDQAIDPAAVLGHVRLEVAGQPVATRLATAEEVQAAGGPPEVAARTLRLRPAEPLPADTDVLVTIDRGVPSREGPRTLEAPVRFAFRTYGPLRVVGHQAGREGRCPPGTPLVVQLSNPLDPRSVEPGQVTCDPPVADLKARPWGGPQLAISGATRPNTAYRVTLGAGLKDIFGQTLGAPVTLEYRTTGPDPALLGPNGEIVLDPAGAPRVTVRSIAVPALRVRVHVVEPARDWLAYGTFRSAVYRDAAATPPGREVLDEVWTVAGKDEWTETPIDLAGALAAGPGHVLVHVQPAEWSQQRYRPHLVAWVQATKLGVDLQADATDLQAWVTRLEDGAPVDGAQVELVPGGETGRTGADGLATVALGAREVNAVVVRQGADSALLPWHGRRREAAVARRWFVFDDRHLYRPGESVHVKGWVRSVDPRRGGDVGPAAPGPVRWQVRDRGRQLLGEGQVTVDDRGAIDLAFELPDTAHVGPAWLELDGHRHGFQIAEFRRPEFEVGVAAASAGPHVAGDAIDVTATASYYAGGPLPGAPVLWAVSSRLATFSPPGRSDFSFGEHVPWWQRHDHEGGRGRFPAPAVHGANLSGSTDAQGRHALRIGLGALTRPLSLKAEALVSDVNRQTWAGSTTLLAHPARVYVGLRPRRAYVSQGEALELDAVLVDLEGAAVAGAPVEVAFERLAWEWKEGALVESVAERQVRPFTSAKEPWLASLPRPTGGTWRVVATARDAAGRLARTVVQVWVAGGAPPPARTVEQEKVTLIPDRPEYADGDEARLLVVSPVFPAEGLLTLRRSGLVRSVRFRLDGPTHELRVPISQGQEEAGAAGPLPPGPRTIGREAAASKDGFVPGLVAHVTLVGSAPREGEATRRRPAYAAGEARLVVPPRRRALAIDVRPAKAELAPGETTTVELVVRDAAGQPVVDAELAVAVVDEAVLALAGHVRPDPLGFFHASRPAGVGDARSRGMLRLQKAKELVLLDEEVEGMQDVPKGTSLQFERRAMAAAPGGRDGDVDDAMGVGGGGGGGRAPAPVALRKDLGPLALFAPRVRTGPGGAATVELKLPDSLTRWRLVVVGAAGERSFGSAEATVTARLPLMVRPSPPRFLSFGDRFELPVVVQNLTDAPLEVDVGVRASNLELTAGAGRRLTVPPRDRREVRFPAAAVRAGRTRLQVVAAAGGRSDAQEQTLPVWTPATAEAFATHGVVDAEGAFAQPLVVPDAWPQVGGLEVTTSSTGLQALTDAVIYLVDYPYGCAEQVASRVLALVALQDVLAAFQAEGLPPKDVLDAAAKADLDRLRELQNPDGGWGFWRAGEPSWPYLTVHVANALARAKAKGHAVDARSLQRAHAALKDLERRIPLHYSPASRRALVAYALHVRDRLGDADPAAARRLLAEAGLHAKPDEGLSIEACGWLLPVLRGAADPKAQEDAARLRRHLANRVTETAGAAHFVTRYSDGAHVLLHSDRRADGVVLEALLGDPAEARGDLAPKLVEGLLGHRTRGRWLNTQENAFVLLALDAYFRAAEGTEPDFVVRAWLGDAFAGEHAFKGRTTERSRLEVPMAHLQQAGGDARSLVLSKEGPGRLYYRIGLRYAPRDLKLGPLEQGFTVQRRYEAVDDPQEVRRDADGTWRIKAGARVRVRVTMVAPARRLHVALVDPLPAGLEPLDPGLRATGALPVDPGDARARRGWWSRTWYEHSGLRDERAEAFTSLLWEGAHTFSYVTRATTPGTFTAAPARAEEMYAPETFGRSGTDRVIVE